MHYPEIGLNEGVWQSWCACGWSEGHQSEGEATTAAREHVTIVRIRWSEHCEYQTDVSLRELREILDDCHEYDSREPYKITGATEEALDEFLSGQTDVDLFAVEDRCVDSVEVAEPMR